MGKGTHMLSALTVIVAGAKGRMGRLFCAEMEEKGATVLRLGREELADGQKLLSEAGHLTVDPSAATGAAGETSRNSGERICAQYAELARKADIVLLCVPVALTGPVASRIAAVLPVPDSAVWADICSVKVEPMRHLARAVRGPVVGAHPLFGPSAKPGAPERRTAVMAGERAEERHVALVERLFRALGCVVFRGTPEEHDRAVAIFQSLNFLTSAAFLSLAAKTPGITPYMTPSFHRRIAASKVLMMDDGELFTGLTFQNNEVRATLSRFTQCLQEFVESPASAAVELESARSWWK